MGAFSFMPDPTADAFTPDQFMEQAYDQPFAKTDAFLAAGTSAVLESADLGTNIRNLMVPEGRTNIIEKRAFGRSAAGMLLEPYVRKPMNWLLGSFGRETDEQLKARGEQPLTAEQYKASPDYRPRVPYDDAMTASRAAALASFDDAKSVREEMARKAPWWVNLSGTAAGGALSPTNYIPVFGEAAASASIGSRVVRSGLDAAANVGVAGLLSAPTRAQYGDDVSFQAQVSQIAMGAAIGGVFGAIGGAWAKRGEARDARTAAILRDAEGRLATVRNGQDSIATLREAVTHLEQDGEINLGEASIDRLDALHDQAADVLPQAEARAGQIRDTRNEGQMYHGAGSPLGTINQYNGAEENFYGEGFYTTDAADIAHGYANRKGAPEPSHYTVNETAPINSFDMEQPVPDWLLKPKSIDDAMGPRLAEVVGAAMKDNPANVRELFDKIRSEIIAEGMRTSDAHGIFEAFRARMEREGYNAMEHKGGLLTGNAEHKVKIYFDPATFEVKPLDIATLRAEPMPVAPVSRGALATKPKPETVQPEATKAAAAVGKPETGKTMAETYGVDPETGAIPEDFELKQIEREGRMKPGSEDAKAMEVANENFETAKSWGEALRAAVACLI